jgi:hypothetical protein
VSQSVATKDVTMNFMSLPSVDTSSKLLSSLTIAFSGALAARQLIKRKNPPWNTKEIWCLD